MPTRIQELGAAVHTNLLLRMADVDLAFGQESLLEHKAARQLTWVERRGRIEEAKRTGGAFVVDERMIQYRSRLARIEVHFRAETDELAEQLMDATICAICDTVGPNADFESYEWATEQRENAGHTLRSDAGFIVFNISLPVIGEESPLRAVESGTHDHGSDEDPH